MINKKLQNALLNSEKRGGLLSLNLSNEMLDDNDAIEISSYLAQDTQVQILELGLNDIQETGLSAISKMLAVNTTLRSLNLSLNSFDDRNVSDLVASLHLNSTLESLSLYGNMVKDAGARLFAELLKSNTTLKKLNLGANEITDIGLASLSVVLRDHQTLKMFNIKENRVTPVGIIKFARAIQGNTSITHLDVGVTSPVVPKELANALRHNFAIVSINLGLNKLSREDCNVISKELQDNWALVEFFSRRSEKINFIRDRNYNFANRMIELSLRLFSGSKEGDYYNICSEGNEYWDLVYKSKITFWDIHKLYRGGFSALSCALDNENFSQRNICAVIKNIKILIPILFVRDFVLGDVKNSKEKFEEYKSIMKLPLFHAPSYNHDRGRFLLNMIADEYLKDDALEERVRLCSSTVFKRFRGCQERRVMVYALNKSELSYLVSSNEVLASVLKNVKKYINIISNNHEYNFTDKIALRLSKEIMNEKSANI